jgi:hypothetical protein
MTASFVTAGQGGTLITEATQTANQLVPLTLRSGGLYRTSGLESGAAGSAASGEFFADAFGAALGLGSLRVGAAPESQRLRRYKLGKISRNIDPPPAGQDDVARDHAQIPFLAAVSLDHILGADRNPPR